MGISIRCVLANAIAIALLAGPAAAQSLPEPKVLPAVDGILGAFAIGRGLRSKRLHLVFAEVVGVEALEPLLETVAVGPLRVEVYRLGVVDHVLFHQDR